MDKQNYYGGPPYAQNPPSYSEKQPSDQQAPPVTGPANSTMPMQYQPYTVPYGAMPSQGAIIQQPQHTAFVVPVQHTHHPDYMAFSIVTLICCCLPLGIAALVYSIRTRDANHAGNGLEAQRNSRMARILATTALVLGILLAIAYIVLVLISTGMID